MPSKINSKDTGSMREKMAGLIPTPDQDDKGFDQLLSDGNSETQQTDANDDLLSLNIFKCADWETTFSDIMTGFENVFEAYYHINDSVENFTLSMLLSGEEPAELERQTNILCSLFRKLSTRVSILCENNIKSIESQLEIIKTKSSYKKYDASEERDVGCIL